MVRNRKRIFEIEKKWLTRVWTNDEEEGEVVIWFLQVICANPNAVSLCIDLRLACWVEIRRRRDSRGWWYVKFELPQQQTNKNNNKDSIWERMLF